MTREITDPDVRILAGISQMLRGDYEQENPEWARSPFGWIKTCPSRQVGKIGEQLVAGWCAAKDLSVGPSGDSEADRVIQGRRVEIKFSTLWKSGQFKFQQIRDQRYDFLVCLGIAPLDARCWVMPKDILYEHVIGHPPQHTGAGGTETFWLSVAAEAPHAWLAPYGGPLSRAYECLRSL